MYHWIEKHSTEIKLFLTVWFVYAVFVTPAGGVLPNRYQDLTFSIVNEGRLSIDTYQENTIDKAYYQGHYYLVALPGPSFLAIPAYLVFKPLYAVLPPPIKQMAGGIQSFKKQESATAGFYAQVDNVEFFLAQMFITLTTQATLSALTSLLIYETIRLLGFETKRAVLVSLFYAFGTIVFFFSTVFFEQIATAVTMFGALYCLLRAWKSPDGRTRSRLIFVSGLLSGSGLLVEYPTVFIAACFGLALIGMGERWRVLFYGLGFLLPVLVLMMYNQAIFGSPITTAYRYIIAAQQHNHAEGFFGVTYPHLSRFLALLFSFDRGLFLFAPITFVGVVGWFLQLMNGKSHRPIVLLCMMVTAMYLLFFSAYTDWRGGATFGPRFLIATLPFIIIGIAFAFDYLPNWFINAIAILSAIINWAGVQFGFADSPLQHIQDVLTRGPTLPVFGAILTHSTSRASSLYVLVAHYHSIMTMSVTLALVALLLWIFRDVLWQHVGSNASKFKSAVTQDS